MTILKKRFSSGCGIKPRRDTKGNLHYLNENEYEFNNAIDRAIYLSKLNDKNFDARCSNFKRKFKTSENIEPKYYEHINDINIKKLKEHGNNYKLSNSRDLVTYGLSIQHAIEDDKTVVYVELFDFKILQSINSLEIHQVTEDILNKLFEYIESSNIESCVIVTISHSTGIADSIIDSIGITLNESF